MELEAIHFYQSSILFAPQTVEVSQIMSLLREHFFSPYLNLRSAAIVCLRQLVQIDASKVATSQIEHDLFLMVKFSQYSLFQLDSEKNVKLRNELQLLLTTLLDLLAADAPTHWIKLCMQMVKYFHYCVTRFRL